MGSTESMERHAHTRIGKVIVALICLIPMLAAVGYGAVDAFALGVIFVLALVVAALWLVDAINSGEFRFSSDVIQLPLLGLILIAVVQLLPLSSGDVPPDLVSVATARALSADPYATRFFLIQLIVYFIFFAAALNYIPGGDRPKKVAIAIVLFGAVLAFAGILQRLSTPDAIYGLRRTPQAISFGPFVNQHHFAALMEMTSGVALGILFGSGTKREHKVVVALAAGIMGMAIIFTGSRGGLIGYLCVVAFSAVASFVRSSTYHQDPDATDRRKRNLYVLIAAGGLVVLVLASVLFLGGEGSLIRSIGMGNTQSDPTSGRAHFWSVGWMIFLANPILGSGLNSFGVVFTKFDTWNGFYRVEQAHNDYLQMLADGGILGIACVAAFIILYLRRAVLAIGERREGIRRGIVTGALAGTLGILIHSFFDFPLRTPANSFFFLLLVVVVVGHGGTRHRHRSAR